MILIEKTQIMGLEPAIRGMRNPMNSWDKSDSDWCISTGTCDKCVYGMDEHNNCLAPAVMGGFYIGPNDFDLMLRLAKAGSVDAKFRRMIIVYIDITAPLYWWKEFETYRTGVTPNPMDIEINSCSTMHKIHAKEFTLEDFSHEQLINEPLIESEPGKIQQYNLQARNMLIVLIGVLNAAREMFLATKDKKYWWQMIQLLPSSYNQKRTVMLNYEVPSNIYQHRRNHKLDEWRELCKWIEGLPYSEVITCNTIERDKSNVLTSAIAKLKAELEWDDGQIAEFLLGQAKLYTDEKTVDVTSAISPITF